MANRIGWWLTGASALAFVLVGVVVVEATLSATSDPAAGTMRSVDTAAAVATTSGAPTPTPPLDPTATASSMATASAAASDHAPERNGVIRVPMSPLHIPQYRASTKGSVFAEATNLAINGDAAGARALLEPRVFGGGTPTRDEVMMLRGICKSQHDATCVAAISARYPQ